MLDARHDALRRSGVPTSAVVISLPHATCWQIGFSVVRVGFSVPDGQVQLERIFVGDEHGAMSPAFSRHVATHTIQSIPFPFHAVFQ
jgi:hypothetical protein